MQHYDLHHNPQPFQPNSNYGNNNTYRKFLIHRLVACAFIPNPDNLPEINHINADTSNNNINNLEWISSKDNK